MPRRQQQSRLRAPRGALALIGAAACASIAVLGGAGFVGGAWRRAAGQGSRAVQRGAVRRASRVRLAAAAAEVSNAKNKLLDFLADEAVSQEVLRPEGKPTKGRVDEAIVALERLNSCDEPVYSELLDGTWEVKYSGSYAPGLLSSPTRELALFLYGGGFSLGNALTSFVEGFWGQSLGLQLSSKVVKIRGGRDVDATVKVDVGGSQREFSFAAELMPLSASRMSEEIVSLELPPPVGKQELPLELRRSILVTYLDDEVMVVRDESGVPDVLVRQGGSATGAAGSSSMPIMEEDPADIPGGGASASSPAAVEEVAEGDDPLSSGAS